jgi:hypothetical protein
MSPPLSNEPVGNGGGSRQFWLFLLLIVLIVALVVYDHGAVRHYGQQAYSRAEHAAQKASKWAKNLYACGIPGCGPKSGTANTSPMQTAPGMVAIADPNPNTAPAAPNAPAATNTEPAAGADTQAAPPENTVAGDQPQAPGMVNYPAYPPYPAYPNYPPDASFGARGFGGDSAPSGGPVGETPPSAPAPAVASSQPALPYLPPSSPPRPPKPEAAPGKPEYPDYPAYPQNPSAATPPMMPPPGMAPPSRAPRPDQRAAPLASEAIGTDGLAQARKSAQAGRLSESVREYLLYLASQPNDVDAYGELGNVYMKIGRFPEAAQNYYEAATRLIDTGHLNAVASLMPVIQMHEPMLATLLNKKIANATAGNQDNRR